MSSGTVRPPTRAGTVLLIPVSQNPRATPAETPVSRPARALPEQAPRGNPRAVREIKNERFQLHKPPVSTSPLPLLSAFPRPFPFREMSAVSRPDLPTQSGRAEGIPVGRQSLPQGEPFPATFPFVGKSRPRGAKTNNF